MCLGDWSKTNNKKNKIKPKHPAPHLAKALGQTSKKKRERILFEKQETNKPCFSLFSLNLSAPTTHTLKKSENTTKEEEKQEEKKEETRRNEEGRPSKPFYLHKLYQNKSIKCINSIIKVGVSKPRT